MLVLTGTVPIKDLPLTTGIVKLKDGNLQVGHQKLPISQGVSTMIASASVCCEALGVKEPYAIIAGDIGKGDGSKAIYKYLKYDIFKLFPKIIVIHYIQPSMNDIKDVIDSVEKSGEKPVLIADAGAMYVAKAAGLANKFDLFTPDLGEMAFLADPDALHPAYVRNFFFNVDATEVPKLIRQAYDNSNSSKFLLVKGQVDYIAKNGEVVTRIDKPNIPEMEAIGGTGDTLTGIVSSLIYANYDLVEAAILAAKVNRTVGELLQPTVATQVSEMIYYIPKALKMLVS